MNDNTITGDITQLIRQWKTGDQEALNDLVNHLYQRLKGITHNTRDRYFNLDLTTTEIFHDIYLKLSSPSDEADMGVVRIENRVHLERFIKVVINHYIIDRIRHNKATKNGAGYEFVTLDEEPIIARDRIEAFLAVDEALQELGRANPEAKEVLELRFLHGFTIQETSQIMGLSTSTINRLQALGNLSLKDHLKGDPLHGF